MKSQQLFILVTFAAAFFLQSFYGFGIRKCICRRESMQSFVEIWNDDDAKSRLFCKTRPRNFKLKPHMCQLSCVFSCCCFAEMRLRKLTLWQNYLRYRPEITYQFNAHFRVCSLISSPPISWFLIWKRKMPSCHFFLQMKTKYRTCAIIGRSRFEGPNKAV